MADTYGEMTNDQLKAELASRGHVTSGNKTELIERLRNDDSPVPDDGDLFVMTFTKHPKLSEPEEAQDLANQAAFQRQALNSGLLVDGDIAREVNDEGTRWVYRAHTLPNTPENRAALSTGKPASPPEENVIDGNKGDVEQPENTLTPEQRTPVLVPLED